MTKMWFDSFKEGGSGRACSNAYGAGRREGLILQQTKIISVMKFLIFNTTTLI